MIKIKIGCILMINGANAIIPKRLVKKFAVIFADCPVIAISPAIASIERSKL